MKIKLTLIMCLVMAQTAIFAQKNSLISFSAGASLPINDFSSTDNNNENAGHAKNGIGLAITYDYKFVSNFGFLAMLKYDNNSVNTSSLSPGNQNGVNWNITSNNYTSFGFLAGIYYAVPIKKSAEFNIRFLAGALNAKLPAVNYQASYQNQNYYINQGEKSETAFSYALGIGFKFHINENLSFLTNADYSDAKVEFKDVITSTNFTIAEPTTGSTKFTRANISIGLGYKF